MVASTRIDPPTGADAELFAAARLRAARDQPYLAAALFAMVPVSSAGHGTFSVDRWWRLYIDFEVAREWGVAATAAVLVHEAHHLVRDHHDRGLRIGATGPRHHAWNLAADAAINDDLVAEGLPIPDPLLPHHLRCRVGGFEEEYYRSLSAPDGDGPDRSCGSGAGGRAHPIEIEEEPDQPDEGLDPLGADAVRRAVAHDVTAAADHGDTVSPGLVRWAAALLQPQVPWVQLLRASVRRDLRAAARWAEIDWTRPDRRGDADVGVLRPGTRRRSPSVAVVIDTSASMERSLLDTAVTEIDALLRQAGVSPVPVVVCDQEAVRAQRIRKLSMLRLSGGGGTDLRRGIAAAAALRPTPRVIVVLTDGATPWPDAAPPRTSVIAVLIDAAGRRPSPEPTGDGFHAVRVTAR